LNVPLSVTMLWFCRAASWRRFEARGIWIDLRIEIRNQEPHQKQ
jgi:hypothetical protein